MQSWIFRFISGTLLGVTATLGFNSIFNSVHAASNSNLTEPVDFKILLYVKPQTQLEGLSAAISDEDVSVLRDTFQNQIPSLVADWSGKQVRWSVDVQVSKNPLTTGPLIEGRIPTVSSSLLESDLGSVAKSRQYDHIFYYYVDHDENLQKFLETKTYFDNQKIDSYTTLSSLGYVTVVPYQDRHHMGRENYFSQWMIHDWISSLDDYYGARDLKVSGVDQFAAAGFKSNLVPRFKFHDRFKLDILPPLYLKDWYRAYLQGQPTGLGPAAWALGTPRNARGGLPECKLAPKDHALLATITDSLKWVDTYSNTSPDETDLDRLKIYQNYIESLQNRCKMDSLYPEALFFLYLDLVTIEGHSAHAHEIKAWLKQDYPDAPQVAETQVRTLPFKIMFLLKRHTRLQADPLCKQKCYPSVQNDISDDEINGLKTVFEKVEPRLIYLYSRGQVSWNAKVAVSDIPVTQVTYYEYDDPNGNRVIGNSITPDLVTQDLAQFTSAQNKYDGIFILAKSKDLKTSNDFIGGFAGEAGGYFASTFQGFGQLNYKEASEWLNNLDFRQSMIHEWMHMLEPLYDGREGIQIPNDRSSGKSGQYGIHDNVPFGFASSDSSVQPLALGPLAVQRVWGEWYRELLTGTAIHNADPTQGSWGFGPNAWRYGNFTTTGLQHP